MARVGGTQRGYIEGSVRRLSGNKRLQQLVEDLIHASPEFGQMRPKTGNGSLTQRTPRQNQAKHHNIETKLAAN